MGFLKWVSIAAAVASTVDAQFTPSKMISAPRRGEAVPNKSGKTAIFSVSRYSFDEHKRSSQWELLDTATGKTSLLTKDSNVGEIAWIDDSTVLYINGSNAEVPGGVELWVSKIHDFGNGYKAASLTAPLGNLKIATTKSGINFIVSGKAALDGTPYNEEAVTKPLTSARVYDDIMVRWWDTYRTPEKSALFSGSLKGGSNTKYSLAGPVKNLFGGVKHLETPVGPFGGSGDFDIAPDGSTVAFLSKDPDLPKANFTSSYIYLVPHDASAKPKAINSPSSPGTPRNARGASGSPVFSPDGRSIAYVQMDEDNYESDRNKVYISSVRNPRQISGIATSWDRSPAAMKWSIDSKTLYLQAEDRGREKIFTIPASAGPRDTPKPLTAEGYVTALYPLNKSTILASNTSLISSVGYSLISTASLSPPKVLLDPTTVDAELHGLAASQISEFWFEGAAQKIHGFMVKPISFDPTKKYPLAFLIHGGPQGAWFNYWSVRWNLAVWANQGYVVVAINPTGSTGYGEALTDAIQNDWGGAPYEDLVRGFEHVVSTYSFIDADRAIAAGASYGCYMVNWIQGHEFGRKFKALVCHDGVFSTLSHYSTEELWFMQHDFNGTLWDAYDNYQRWDPAKPELIKQWATPELVIHNDLDYRLPVAEGIATFNVLQERGVPSRFLNFPDENHWVLSPENSLAWHKEVLGWINKWTGIGEAVL